MPRYESGRSKIRLRHKEANDKPPASFSHSPVVLLLVYSDSYHGLLDRN